MAVYAFANRMEGTISSVERCWSYRACANVLQMVSFRESQPGIRGGLKHLVGDAVRNRNFDKMLIGGHHQIGVDELFHERCGIVLRGVDVPASRIEAGAFGIIDRKGAVRVPDAIACQDRNSDCSVVKASIRLGTVRVIGGHHGAAVPRHSRYHHIHPRHVGADPNV